MKDYYLYENHIIERLVEEWDKYGKIIIAYDFDDTVFDFHNKGRTYNNVIQLLKRCNKIGAYFIVFTSCDSSKYEFIKNYLLTNSIPFDKINENMEFVKFSGRKIYSNILLDDRSGLPSAYRCLLNVVKIKEKQI